MRISVALCTYNGAQYLPQQFDSIIRQTRPPDELVICDDGSRDDTLSISHEFAVGAPFAVHIHENEHNLGYVKNFEQAINYCEGDVIALCDQDDIWLPQKLATMEAIFREHPGVGCVFSDAELVDGEAQQLGKTQWQAIGFDHALQEQIRNGDALQILLRRPYVTGATMAFRTTFREFVTPIPATAMHDEWIALLIATVARLYPIPQALIQYRQHEGNQLGSVAKRPVWKRTGDRSRYQARIDSLQAACERLTGRDDLLQPATQLETLFAGKIQHLQTRDRIQRQNLWRIPLAFRELLRGGYHRYSGGTLSFLRDCVG